MNIQKFIPQRQMDEPVMIVERENVVKKIGGPNNCFIIGEIGQNHNGDVNLAMDMIKMSKTAGVDCVKLQISTLNERFTKSALDRPYDSPNSYGSTYREHRNALALTREELTRCQQVALDQGVLFTASGTDYSSINFLVEKLNVPFIKIGSGDVNNLPLIKYASEKFDKPLVVSTGMVSSVTVIDDLYRTICSVRPNSPQLALLHCVSSYPTDDEDVNLQLIPQFKTRYPKAVIGYSGHEVATEISIAAVALGAKVIERHVTFDCYSKGSDHKCSLSPDQLKQLVNGIRRVEKAFGSCHLSQRKRLKCEEECYRKLGKFVVSNCKLLPGDQLSKNNISIKVINANDYNLDDLFPGEKYEKLLKIKVKKEVAADSPIESDHLFMW